MSAPTLKHLQMKDANGVAVINFVDSGLMFEATLIQEVGEELHSLLTDHGRSRILLDFSQVRYLSSSMLGQLARLAKDVASARGQLKITGLGPVLRDTFRISHLEPLFEFFDDQAAALKAFH
jgi:anti-sigma B factor antagonist